MLEYDLCEYDGGLYIVPCYSPFLLGDDILIDNVPGAYIIVRYEIDDNGKPIIDSDEIVFVYNNVVVCEAKINKLRAACRGSKIRYYIPELRTRRYK